MQQEMMFFTQLLNQAGGGWLPAVLLGGLLLALLFKPERVCSWPLFRLSCCLLGSSLIITPILNVMMNMAMPYGLSQGGGNPFPFIVAAIYAISPILQGLSVICGLLSMIPVRTRSQLSPMKHLLE